MTQPRAVHEQQKAPFNPRQCLYTEWGRHLPVTRVNRWRPLHPSFRSSQTQVLQKSTTKKQSLQQSHKSSLRGGTTRRPYRVQRWPGDPAAGAGAGVSDAAPVAARCGPGDGADVGAAGLGLPVSSEGAD